MRTAWMAARPRLAAMAKEAPPLVAALAIAEMLFKFGSFTLELIGFAAVWFVLDRWYRVLRTLVSRRFAAWGHDRVLHPRGGNPS